jgi:hypothetical protein
LIAGAAESVAMLEVDDTNDDNVDDIVRGAVTVVGNAVGIIDVVAVGDLPVIFVVDGIGVDFVIVDVVVVNVVVVGVVGVVVNVVVDVVVVVVYAATAVAHLLDDAAGIQDPHRGLIDLFLDKRINLIHTQRSRHALAIAEVVGAAERIRHSRQRTPSHSPA